MRRQRLDSDIVELDKLQATIRRLQAVYSDYETQIEVLQSNGFLDDHYFVTIWRIK